MKIFMPLTIDFDKQNTLPAILKMRNADTLLLKSIGEVNTL